MARERSIVVRLKAEISDFQTQMGNASRSLSDFEKGQQKLGGAADTTMGRLVQSAKLQQAEWQTVGRTLAVTGGAITGLGAAVLKTGIDYNSLRQNATKSLESVTGSTEGAANQMRRLDDYGKNSWLMRDVLIRAQQNMSGFGIETGKVIPYMDALAEAVAGTTGSQQSFEELARLMGQIESQGKITARELNQFGIRGIDAAELIGSAMGKTADQIRTEITAGTLDAGEALDALAEGMMNTYEGSSDRLRDTWQGAFDNLKGAWRDLGAELAKPLVDPDGGGFLVDLTNNVADFLNAIGQLPGPVKTAVGALASIGGVAALAGGAFFLLAPRAVEVYGAFKSLSATFPGVASGLGKVARSAGIIAGIGAGVAITAGAFIKLADALGDSGVPANADRITAALAEVDGMNMDTLFLDATAGAYDLNDAMGHLADMPFGHEWGMDVAETLGITSNSALNAKNTFEELDTHLAGMVQGGQTEQAAHLFELLYGNLDQTKYSTQDLRDMLPGYQDALAGAAGETEIASGASEEFVGALEEVGIAADGTIDSLETYLDLLFETGLAAMSERDAHRRYQESLEGIGEAIDEVVAEHGGLSAALNDSKTDFDETTEAGRIAGDAFDALAKQGMTAAEAMVENGASQEDVQTALKGTYDDLVAAANEFGITGEAASDLAREVLGVPEGVDIETWMDEYAKEVADELAEKLDVLPEDIVVDADIGPADGRIDFLLNRFEEKPPPLIVDADTEPADGRVNFLLNRVGNTTTATNVDANTAPADSGFRGLTSGWNSTTTQTNLDANDAPANSAFIGITSDWRGTTTNTNLDADTSPASSGFSTVTGNWRNTTTTTKIDADTSPARSAWSSFRSSIGNITTSIIAKVTGGKYEGGWVNPGRFEGGLIDVARTMTGLKAGGWVPGERAGYDNVMWPLRAGGQVLNQPLEGREFVVNSRDAARYPQELNAMNNGTYPTGMLERAHSPATSIDYQRLASALGGREHVEQHMHLHTANASITDGIDGFNRMNMAESRR